MEPSLLEGLIWPASRITEAIGHLAVPTAGHHKVGSDPLPAPPIGPEHGEQIGVWIQSTATGMDLEALAAEVTYRNVRELLEMGPPTVLRLPGSAAAGHVVLLTGGKRHLTLLGLDAERHTVATGAFVRQLRSALEEDETAAEAVNRILEHGRLRGRRRRAARDALFRELHGEKVLGNCWLIRPTAAAPLGTQSREARLGTLLTALTLLHLTQFTFWILAWWLLGWMSARGRFEEGLFQAWTLLLLAMVPFRVLSQLFSGTLAIRAGILLKRRLLAGVFRLETQEVRQWGVGQLLGRVIESQAVESLALSGGFLALTGCVELLLTTFVLGMGAGSWLHVIFLVATLGLAGGLAARFGRRQIDWTESRLELTNDMVEQMIGHRTRMAQQSPDQWNHGEDEALARYLSASRQMDTQAAVLAAVVPRGWLVVGLIGLAPAFITGGSSNVSLAIGLGGVILAYRALRSLIEGGLRLFSAAIAWRRIQFLVEAARRREPVGRPQAGLVTPADGRPVVTAKDLVFRFRGRGRPVLQGVDLEIRRGERLLLQGSSGGGKSTLASLLAGCRVSESGLLLLHGLDRETLGADNWRRRVVISPQFHENHVLIGPLSFNLLMGRRWPPTPSDLDEAERTCRALGLGPLLDRMPGGMSQMVGETGWQLSHGEKSRLFIARALLQRADLTILDESFAALDPQNLRLTLSHVLDQTPTVLVIAHP